MSGTISWRKVPLVLRRDLTVIGVPKNVLMKGNVTNQGYHRSKGKSSPRNKKQVVTEKVPQAARLLVKLYQALGPREDHKDSL